MHSNSNIPGITTPITPDRSSATRGEPAILAINPGSTSTKIAVYHGEEEVFQADIAHDAAELSQFATVLEQRPFRLRLVLEALGAHAISLRFDAVIGRGGLARPVAGGVYEVSDEMIRETLATKHQHACDLGCVLAREIADRIPGCHCLTADPGRVDELAPEARVSGSPLLPRICIWHALNQKAIARRYAREHGLRYEDLDLIVCHLGGGISVAAHHLGRAIDANNALDGEGPFSPERAGSLPVADLIRLCFSGRFTEQELLRRVAGQAGLIAHLGTNDMRLITRRIADGDHHAAGVVDAMIWHIAKAIVSEAAVLCGQPHAILLTGGLAHSEYLVTRLKKRIDFLAPVFVYPGQNEMQALAENARRWLREQTGEE